MYISQSFCLHKQIQYNGLPSPPMKSGHRGPPHASLHAADFMPLEKHKPCSLSECQFHLSIVSGSVCQLHRFQTYVLPLHSLITSHEWRKVQGRLLLETAEQTKRSNQSWPPRSPSGSPHPVSALDAMSREETDTGRWVSKTYPEEEGGWLDRPGHSWNQSPADSGHPRTQYPQVPRALQATLMRAFY